MKLSCFSSVFLVMVALVVAGCSHGARPGGVTVSLVDFRPTESALLESRGTLTLRYTNENISALGFRGSRHKLYLNGKFVGRAVSDEPFGIPPMNTVTQDVTVNFENLALIRQLVDVGESQTVAYRIESVLLQTIYDEKFEIRTEAEGVLDLSGIRTPAAP